MRRLHVLNISDIEAAPTVGQAMSSGPSKTTPSADSAHGRGLLRVEEAAIWLGLSKRTMYELLNRGEIPMAGDGEQLVGMGVAKHVGQGCDECRVWLRE